MISELKDLETDFNSQRPTSKFSVTELTPENNEKSLKRTQNHSVPLKVFDDEVRSTLDVDHYLCNASLVLDLEVSRN